MSHIRLSRDKNYGPIIPPNMAHIIMSLEPLETLRIIMDYGNEETLFIVNSRPIYPLNVIAGEVEYPDPQWIKQTLSDSGGELFWLEATPIAIELGGPVMLNMIMVGALCALPLFPMNEGDVKAVLKDVFPESKLEPNYRALEIGRGLIAGNEN